MIRRKSAACPFLCDARDPFPLRFLCNRCHAAIGFTFGLPWTILVAIVAFFKGRGWVLCSGLSRTYLVLRFAAYLAVGVWGVAGRSGETEVVATAPRILEFGSLGSLLSGSADADSNSTALPSRDSVSSFPTTWPADSSSG